MSDSDSFKDQVLETHRGRINFFGYNSYVKGALLNFLRVEEAALKDQNIGEILSDENFVDKYKNELEDFDKSILPLTKYSFFENGDRVPIWAMIPYFKQNTILGQYNNVFEFKSFLPKHDKIMSLDELTSLENYYYSYRFDGKAAMWMNQSILSRNSELEYLTYPKSMNEFLISKFPNDILVGTMIVLNTLNKNDFTKFHIQRSFFPPTGNHSDSKIDTCKRLCFCVYDCFSYDQRNKNFEERYAYLQQKFSDNTEYSVVLVQHEPVSDKNELLDSLAKGFVTGSKGLVFVDKSATFLELHAKKPRKKIGVLPKILCNLNTSLESSPSTFSWDPLPRELSATIKVRGDLLLLKNQTPGSQQDFTKNIKLRKESRILEGRTEGYIFPGIFPSEDRSRDETRYLGAHVLHSFSAENPSLKKAIVPPEVGERLEIYYNNLDVQNKWKKKIGNNDKVIQAKLCRLGYNFDFINFFISSEKTDQFFKDNNLFYQQNEPQTRAKIELQILKEISTNLSFSSHDLKDHWITKWRSPHPTGNEDFNFSDQIPDDQSESERRSSDDVVVSSSESGSSSITNPSPDESQSSDGDGEEQIKSFDESITLYKSFLPFPGVNNFLIKTDDPVEENGYYVIDVKDEEPKGYNFNRMYFFALDNKNNSVELSGKNKFKKFEKIMPKKRSFWMFYFAKKRQSVYSRNLNLHEGALNTLASKVDFSATLTEEDQDFLYSVFDLEKTNEINEEYWKEYKKTFFVIKKFKFDSDEISFTKTRAVGLAYKEIMDFLK